jgi:hypothetical protein
MSGQGLQSPDRLVYFLDFYFFKISPLGMIILS